MAFRLYRLPSRDANCLDVTPVTAGLEARAYRKRRGSQGATDEAYQKPGAASHLLKEKPPWMNAPGVASCWTLR